MHLVLAQVFSYGFILFVHFLIHPASLVKSPLFLIGMSQSKSQFPFWDIRASTTVYKFRISRTIYHITMCCILGEG